MKNYISTWILLGIFTSLGFAQQPGMKMPQPMGVRPHGIGKKKDAKLIHKRTLVVVKQDENSLDLKSVNASLKSAVDKYWKLKVRGIEFKSEAQVQPLIDNRDTGYVILRLAERLLTITDLPEEDAPTSLTVRSMEIFLPENKRKIATLRLPDDVPKEGEIILALKQLQHYLAERGASWESQDPYASADTIKGMAGKILLIDKNDFIAFKESDMDEITSLYSMPVQVVGFPVIEKALKKSDPKYAVVQLVHYRRTQSLHYIIDAHSGKFIGHFRTGNPIGDYLHYHQHVTMSHIKKYGDIAGISYAKTFSKRFSDMYCKGMEISPRFFVQQSWYNGKSYDNKTIFTERLPETNSLVSHVGTTEYKKTVGYGFGVSGTNYMDSVWSAQAAVYYSFQGQKFLFTHYDSLQKKNRTREIEFRLEYIKIPLFLAANTNSRKDVVFQIFAGPQLGLLKKAEELIDGESYDDILLQRSFKNKSDRIPFSSSFKSIDLAAAAGIGVHLKISGNIFGYLGGRWDYSILDADTQGQWKDASLSPSRNMTLAAECGLSYLF
ncbi:MAG: PorT family protein [Flavobacteriales bacterium]|nr:PorT family protein [Flavobacteriales bacterium]